MLGLGSLPIAIPLRGNISPSLVELQHLNYLDPSNNNFGGSRIPEFIGSLSNLRHLNLSYAGFGGTVPSQLGNLSKLQSLDLSPYGGMNVQNLEWLSHLSSLRHLNLQNVDLSNAKEWFQSVNKLPLLTSLRLGLCRLPKIVVPSYINFSTSLAILDLSGNGLTSSSFDWLFNFSSALIEVDLSNNRLQATIPSWFWDLSPRMRLLNISYNQINGIMPDLSLKFPAFPAIDLSSNHFAGPIPFLPCTATSLNLSKNKFSGSVSFLCTIKFEQLTRLDLSDNIIDGEVPDCWMQFTYLDVLNLANNNLTGKIPRSLGSILKLKVLQLRNNSFTGELPLPLRNCINLIIIDLGDNRISGTIPTWIGESLSMLVVFSLRSNEFHGSIPTNFCQLNNIQILDLSLNNISGTIPMCLDNFLAMTQTKRFDPTIYVIYDQTYTIRDGEEGYYSPHYVLSALLVWKGREYEYKNTLGLVKSIDLSKFQAIS
ncbi:hypothetical protein CsSME_00039230 [Camellia sinensis var. sinensis]